MFMYVINVMKFSKMDEYMEKEFLTLKEISELLRMSQTQIVRMAKSGKIPSYKIGARRLFKREEIDKWLENYKDIKK